MPFEVYSVLTDNIKADKKLQEKIFLLHKSNNDGPRLTRRDIMIHNINDELLHVQEIHNVVRNEIIKEMNNSINEINQDIKNSITTFEKIDTAINMYKRSPHVVKRSLKQPTQTGETTQTKEEVENDIDKITNDITTIRKLFKTIELDIDMIHDKLTVISNTDNISL